jgi:hypothetical protein
VLLLRLVSCFVGVSSGVSSVALLHPHRHDRPDGCGTASRGETRDQDGAHQDGGVLVEAPRGSEIERRRE